MTNYNIESRMKGMLRNESTKITANGVPSLLLSGENIVVLIIYSAEQSNTNWLRSTC
jgi:hypothetical protein